MKILLNGEPYDAPDACTAAGLVNLLQLGECRIAMEVNLEIVPASEYPNHVLSEGDKVEVVHAIGGG